MGQSKNGVKKKQFDVNNSFMSRIAGIRDEFTLCERMKELLVCARDVFFTSSVKPEDYQILVEATDCTEKVFSGEYCDELLDHYYRLGVILDKLGHEDLGVAFQYLHHIYRNRPRKSWPPVKVRENGQSERLERLLPINELSFDDLEADTENDIVPLRHRS